ncbi:MAG TPA: Xaa-Pro peptidase family protein [Candidatus Binatia bacterium]|nr:Xaa-Pro peptidase family protein [Candidatus Binatia bacterium]
MSDDARLVFPRAEYENRLQAVRAAMAARRVDVLLVDETEHLAYVAGWHASGSRYHGCLVPADGEPVMVFRRLDEPAFLERSWLHDRVCFADTQDPVEAIVRTISARGWADARLGVETDSHYLTVQTYEALRRALPRATFVDFSTVLRELRLRKSPREIEYLRRAADIADQAMREAVAAVGEGVSERAAAIAASRTFLRLGADTARTGPITAGARSGTLHGLLGDHRLSQGDILHMELVPSISGYSARLMRPTAIGPPSTEQADTAARLIEIQDDQIAAMKPGAVARDVDRVCRARVLDAGLRESYDNFTGYTLGYYGATHPPRTSDFTRAFVPTADWVLEPGMVFHMYTGARGMSFSETVLVTESGPERLTQLERRLFVR